MSDNNLYCNIAFPIPIKQEYTYCLPSKIVNKESNKKNFIGYRVTVDFGRQKNKIGVIVEVFDKINTDMEIKFVKDTVENFPFFTQEQILLAKQQAYNHYVSTGMFLNEIFPIEHKYTFHQAILAEKNVRQCKIEFDKNVLKILQKTADHVLFIPRNINEKFMFYFNVILYTLNSEGQLVIVFPTNEYIVDFINFLRSTCKDDKIFMVLQRNIFIYSGEIDLNERYKIWCMFKTGEIKVVLSTKIGVFLPFNKVSYVIVDEPDSLGYKNPEVPMYNAISVLEERLKKYKCKLIYSSFVPSVENMYKLRNKVVILNGKQECSDIKIQFVKKKLKEVITRNLYKFKQTIIMFPYKGYSRYQFCLLCRKVVFYTKKKTEFVCPYCGGKRSIEYGTGGEKFVKILSSLFKDATIEYLDADTKQEKVRSIIENFNNEKIDILVTTPAIFNYIYRLNFSNVGSVYFSYLDSFLYRPSYLSYEMVYKMIKLTEVLLNSYKSSAEVFLELFHTERYNEVLLSRYEKFVKKELKVRKELKYPPFSHIIHIGVVSKDQHKLKNITQDIEQKLKGISNILVFPAVDSKHKEGTKKTVDAQLTVKILKNVDHAIKNIIKTLNSISSTRSQNIYIDYKPVV